MIKKYNAILAMSSRGIEVEGLSGITASSAMQNGYDTAREQGHKPGTREFDDAALIATVRTAELYEVPFMTYGQKEGSRPNPATTLSLNSPKTKLDDLYPDDPNDPEPTPDQIPELDARIKRARQYSDALLARQGRTKEASRGDSVIAPGNAEDLETRRIGYEALGLHGLISNEEALLHLYQMDKVKNAGSPGKQDSARARILQDYDPRGLGNSMLEVDPATGQLRRKVRVGRGQSELSDDTSLAIAELFHENLGDQTVEDENGQIQVVTPAREHTLRNQRTGINPKRTTSFEAGMKRPSDALSQIADNAQSLNELSGHSMAPLVRGATTQDPEYGDSTYADGSKAPSVYDIGKAEAERKGRRFAVNPLPNYEPPEIEDSGIPDMTPEEAKATRRNFSLASDEDLFDPDESGLPDMAPVPGETPGQLRQRIRAVLSADRNARDAADEESARNIVNQFVRPEVGSPQHLRDTLQDAIQHAHEISRIHANEIDQSDNSYKALGTFYTSTGDAEKFGQVGEGVDGEGFDDKIYSGGGSGDAEAPAVNGPQYESNHLKQTRYFARLQQDEDHADRVQQNAANYVSSLTDDDIDQWAKDNFPNGGTEDQIKSRFVADHLGSIAGMNDAQYPMDANPFAVRGQDGYSIPRDLLADQANSVRSQNRGTVGFIVDAARRGELGKLNSQYNQYEGRAFQSMDVQGALDYLEQIKRATNDHADLYNNTKNRSEAIVAKMLAKDQQRQLEAEAAGLPAQQNSTEIDLSSVDDVVNKVLSSDQMANLRNDTLALMEIERDARRQYRQAALSYQAGFGQKFKPESMSAVGSDPMAPIQKEIGDLKNRIAERESKISKMVSPNKRRSEETELRKDKEQLRSMLQSLNQRGL